MPEVVYVISKLVQTFCVGWWLHASLAMFQPIQQVDRLWVELRKKDCLDNLITDSKPRKNLPFKSATSLGLSFSSIFDVRTLCDEGRISTFHKNSSMGEQMRTRWFFESAIMIRPSSSQHKPDGRQNSCKAEPSCPLVAKIYKDGLRIKSRIQFNVAKLTLVIDASIKINRWFSKSEMMMFPWGLNATPLGVVNPFK